MNEDAPVDDLSDDVTMAADPDLVDQIRRKAAKLRKAEPATERRVVTHTADDKAIHPGDDLEDDITVPAAAKARVQRSETAERTALLRQQAPRSGPNDPTAITTSPVADDDVSLIEERPAPAVAPERAWEPPSRFETANTPSTPAPRSSTATFALILLGAIILTATLTALVILYLTDPT